MRLVTQYITKLETANYADVAPILDAKLAATSPQRLADYVGLAVENLESTKKRMMEAEKELKEMRAEADHQLSIIKEGAAHWLADVGIDKLSGDIVSSVSVFEQAPERKLIVTDEEHLINLGYFKTILDKVSVKQAIDSGVNIDGAHIEVMYREDSVKINKRRKSNEGYKKSR